MVTLTFSGSETDPESRADGGRATRRGLVACGRPVHAHDWVVHIAERYARRQWPASVPHLRGRGRSGAVDQVDLAQFRAALNSSYDPNNPNDPNNPYRIYLDANDNGTEDQLDLGQFRGRMNFDVFI